jgi:hypothetical protein
MVNRHDRLIYIPIIFNIIIMVIIVTNLGLLVGCGSQVGNNGGIFIGYPEDSFNIGVQLPLAATHPSQLPASLPYNHQLFPSVISFAY